MSTIRPDSKFDNMEEVKESESKVDHKTEKLPMKTDWKKFPLTVVQNITVEPFIFLYCLGFGITMIISPILYMNKICSVGTICYVRNMKTQVQMFIESLLGGQCDFWQWIDMEP